MKGDVDFGAEGLLDGLDGDFRDARLELLEQLSADGVALDELKRAIAADRLVLLPVERRLSSEVSLDSTRLLRLETDP